MLVSDGADAILSKWSRTISTGFDMLDDDVLQH